jgi:hypothetical protein
MIEVGVPKLFIRVELEHQVKMYQQRYPILELFGMSNCKPVSTLLPSYTKLSKAKEDDNYKCQVLHVTQPCHELGNNSDASRSFLSNCLTRTLIALLNCGNQSLVRTTKQESGMSNVNSSTFRVSRSFAVVQGM